MDRLLHSFRLKGMNEFSNASFLYSLYIIDEAMKRLASCPWGPVTANGVDLLTEISLPVHGLRQESRGITEGKLGNI